MFKSILVCILSSCLISTAYSEEKPSLEMIEIERHYNVDRSIDVIYLFKTKNIAEGTPLGINVINTLLVKNSLVFPSKNQSLYVGTKGFLFSREQKQPYPVGLHDMSKGEAITYELIDQKLKVVATHLVIAHPIEAKSKIDQACVSLRTLNLNYTFCEVSGRGFKPNEKIDYVSISAGEKIGGPFNINEDGTFYSNIHPAVIGKNKGSCHVEYRRKDETLKFDFNWGTHALKVLRHDLKLTKTKVVKSDEKNPVATITVTPPGAPISQGSVSVHLN